MTSNILMIEPVAFGFNEETAANNYFQQFDQTPADRIQAAAQQEFAAMVAKLRAKGVNVISIPDTLEPRTPDSVFPNNWVSFHQDGRVVLYPMFAPNRRAERRDDILQIIQHKGFQVKEIVDYTKAEDEARYLEGTGSMVLDREARIAYAVLSERTDQELLTTFCRDFGYTSCCFHAMQHVDGKRLPIYHTNVMMCVADKYAVVGFDSMDDFNEREALRNQLKASGKEVIVELTEAQIHRFAGNMLQVKNEEEIPLLVLSQTAYDALNPDQITALASFNELVTVNIPTIERYGGGSARCMMAEIYNITL
ncbi:MAG: hypothetical protein H6Q13_134 [Bacteroidetes bacterium]|nr:hypothetical protein [Bacteroidota bacterium]